MNPSLTTFTAAVVVAATSAAAIAQESATRPAPDARVDRVERNLRTIERLLKDRDQGDLQPFLGVGAVPADAAARTLADLPAGVGLVVTEVTPDSPAAEAGLIAGDVLREFDGQLLVNFDQLRTLIALAGAGGEAELKIVRGGEAMTLPATLGERKAPPQAAPALSGMLVLPDGQRVPLDNDRLILPVPMPGADPDLADMIEDVRRATEQIEANIRQLEVERAREQDMGRVLRQRLNDMEQLLRNNLDNNRLQLDALQNRLPAGNGVVAGTNVAVRDDAGSATLNVNPDGTVRLRVADADGREVYAGDRPGEDELAALPEADRTVVERRLRQLDRYLPRPAGPGAGE